MILTWNGRDFGLYGTHILFIDWMQPPLDPTKKKKKSTSQGRLVREAERVAALKTVSHFRGERNNHYNLDRGKALVPACKGTSEASQPPVMSTRR